MTSTTKRAISLLLVDDDSEFAQSISSHESTAREGWTVRTARDCNEALDQLNESRADIIVTKLNLPGDSGDLLLSTAKREFPNALRFLLIDPFGSLSIPPMTHYLYTTLSIYLSIHTYIHTYIHFQ